jgi:hypothetical protein
VFLWFLLCLFFAALKHLNVASIPADVMTQITEWPVKSAFITKGHAEHAKVVLSTCLLGAVWPSFYFVFACCNVFVSVFTRD